MKPYFGGILVGKTIGELKQYLPNVQARVVAIYRGSRSLTLTPSTVIEIGDEVFVIAPSRQIRSIMPALRKMEACNKNIIIAGGGNVGERLALKLENKYNVKIVFILNPKKQFICMIICPSVYADSDVSA